MLTRGGLNNRGARCGAPRAGQAGAQPVASRVVASQAGAISEIPSRAGGQGAGRQFGVEASPRLAQQARERAMARTDGRRNPGDAGDVKDRMRHGTKLGLPRPERTA